jgi:hypothetical protein
MGAERATMPPRRAAERWLAPTTHGDFHMSGSIKLSVIAATAALAALSVALPQAANAQVGIQIGPQPQYHQQYPQQAQQPPRGGAWGDRDRDGVPNAFDSTNNRRRGGGDQDHDGIPNRYDQDRDGDGRPNQWDRSPANPHR